jgi:hypothetical protein
MTRVLKFFLGDLARLGKLRFGASFVGLQACHFVNANGMRVELVVKLWRFKIGLANKRDLLLKQLGILLGRVAPILAFVRLEINFSKDSIHVAHRNGINQATLSHLVGKLFPGPRSHRTTTVFWRFTGDPDQAHNLLGREFSRRAASWSIAETLDNSPLKGSSAFRELHSQQGCVRIAPASSPDTDRFGRNPQSTADRPVVVLLKSHQDDLRSRHDAAADVSAQR